MIVHAAAGLAAVSLVAGTSRIAIHASAPAPGTRVQSGSTHPSQPAEDRVLYHGGIVAGQAVAISPAGVLTRNGGAEFTLGWDRVAAVEGTLAAQAAPYQDLARKAWRARTRLERGDAVAAEPLYEDLFAHLSQTDGPTALAICEGLLRCRLWRGAHALALSPWLQWVRLQHDESASGTAGRSEADASGRIWAMALLPIIDEPTGLVVSLPPVWLSGPSVRALVARPTPLVEESADDGPGVARARALAALYLHAARYEGGERSAAPEPGDALRRDPGVALVADVVLARTGDAAQRTTARAALRTRLATELPGWQEAWCRVGLGRSLLIEPDPAAAMEGVVELMHLPARFGQEQPYLTGVALAEAAAALDRLGARSEADTLDRLLAQSFAGHPAMEWADLPRRTGSPAAPPASSAPSRAEEDLPPEGEATPGRSGAPR